MLNMYLLLFLMDGYT